MIANSLLRKGLRRVWITTLLTTIALSSFLSKASAQLNTNSLMIVARNSLYYEEYVMSIQYLNMIISAKPYLYEPWLYRGMAKFYLDDFSGCESDCSQAISRNPYAATPHELRGLARINQKNYKEAAEDYETAVNLEPQNKSLWHNLVYCEIENDKLAKADSLCDKMIKKWSRFADGYCLKANIMMQQGDTLGAETFIDKALDVDKYNINAITIKGGILMFKQNYPDAEKMYDEALRLDPKNTGSLINRALCKYHEDNYRGAMKDYDMALEIEPHNFIGHYNRGLLLANVGEDNKAIEDFNFIINIDPEDMMAVFNRGELYMNTGEYQEAIKDYTTVINEYPNFLYGYQRRAEAKRKTGDKRGADKDDEYVFKESMAHKYGYAKKKTRTKNSTRKKSERKIDDYDKLLEDDNNETQYDNTYKGKIQNRNVEAKLIKTIPEQTRKYNDLISTDINEIFEQAYDKAQNGNIKDAIDDLNKIISLNDSFGEAYYNRGLLKLFSNDVTEAITDLSKSGELGIYSAYNIIKKNQNKKNK